eukprot:g9507.t1
MVQPSEVEETTKPPELDGPNMSPAMCRRYALCGSGETLLLLAVSTMRNAGLVRLPYADMLAPSQSSLTPPAAPEQGPWGEWLRIIASFCSCGRSSCQRYGGEKDNLGLPTATISPTSTTDGCCCCVAVAIECAVQQAKVLSTSATTPPRNLCILSSIGGGGGGVPAAEELLSRAIHHLCDSDWAEWLRAPLIGAASQGDLDTVRLLLKAGFESPSSRGIGAWMIPGGDGRTLLHVAADSGNAGVIEALLHAGAGVVVNAVTGRRGGRQSSRGFSPFHVAVIKGSIQAAMVLARAGAAVHRRAPFQQSALHLAAGTGNAEMVYALVTELRLALEGRDDLGGTALHAAAWHGEAECVRALLALGAQVDTRDECGRSPLFQACRCGGGSPDDSPDAWVAVGELVGAGADVNAKSEDGDTPLHVACRYGHTETVRILLRHDADETARCDLGKTPWDVANGEALRAARRRSRCVNAVAAAAACNDGVSSGGAGRGTGDNKNDFTIEVAEAIHAALAAAPADRAWRRRGWLAILRSRLIEFDKRRLSENTQVCTGSFEVGAGRNSLASVDLSVGMLVQDANESVSPPHTWAAMDLEEERDIFGSLGGLPEHFQENVAGFGGRELDEAFCGNAARISEEYVRGLKRLCTRKHALVNDALTGGGGSGGFATMLSGGLELRAGDVSANNFVDFSLGSLPSTPEKICAPDGGSRAGGWGFQQHKRVERVACDGDGWSHEVAVGGTTNIGDNCSSSSSDDDDEVVVFYEVVLQTLEMADGLFEIIVGYV